MFYFPHAFWSNGSLLNKLLAFWNCNDSTLNNGSTVADALGNYNATVTESVGTDITSVAGKINSGIKINAANAYISLTDSAKIFNINTLSKTFVLWFKTDSHGTGSGLGNYLFSKWFENTADRQYICANNDGALTFTVRTTPGDIDETVETPQLMSNSNWYFCVIKHDVVQKQISAQINNGIVYTTTYSNSIADSSLQFCLNDVAGTEDANIDALGVWNRVLTSAEITYLYNNGNGKEYPL